MRAFQFHLLSLVTRLAMIHRRKKRTSAPSDLSGTMSKYLDWVQDHSSKNQELFSEVNKRESMERKEISKGLEAAVCVVQQASTIMLNAYYNCIKDNSNILSKNANPGQLSLFRERPIAQCSSSTPKKCVQKTMCPADVSSSESEVDMNHSVSLLSPKNKTYSVRCYNKNSDHQSTPDMHSGRSSAQPKKRGQCAIYQFLAVLYMITPSTLMY